MLTNSCPSTVNDKLYEDAEPMVSKGISFSSSFILIFFYSRVTKLLVFFHLVIKRLNLFFIFPFPMIIMYIFMQKFYVEGIASTGIKG